MTAHWTADLPGNPCREAREWCLTQPDYPTAWDACPRGDWLLWLAGRVGVDRRLLVLAACDCARLALVHVPAGEERPRRAIETAERWARGEATLDDVRDAASAAYAASADADADVASAAYYAASVAYYAAFAAFAAYAAAAAAAAAAADAAAADAAYAAYVAYAADADAADAASAASAAYSATLARCAALVRARIARPDLGGAP